ncbi:unnamed protein product [Rotaria magnacalcarata]|uniref:Uncharacterized protein n=2 Tax=Rotaria magnacalcarata TaxID=392030 RepID=A0A819P6H3_9BILA|nr:unnamed protein product [Rotaria magnacalcarata]CAF4145916.1 unnamed protein product [Rotaria magnacalcarata]
MKYLYYFMFLHLIFALPQINLHNTYWVSENETNDVLEHDCLRVDALVEEGNISHEIISYCMSELPSKFHIEKNDFFPKFTFDELSKQNITSQQLYLWSASIDLAEYYQFYLNELSTLNQSSLSREVFYNCTLPRFGSMCQYEIDYYHPKHSSLHEIIDDFYRTYKYDPTNFTCYSHLQCNRGHPPSCLDWTEVCNGQIDCIDGGFDEEYCWQLEINECSDNEYRCANGQCIPKPFFQDDTYLPDCLDGTDEVRKPFKEDHKCIREKPSFKCEDVTCRDIYLGSSCVSKRAELLIESMYSIQDYSISSLCWSAFMCIGIRWKDPYFSNCTASCTNRMCEETIERECPDMFYIPTIPVLFGDIYFAYEKYRSTSFDLQLFKYPYACYNNSRYNSHFIKVSNATYNYSTVLFNNIMCHRLIDRFLFAQSMVNSLTQLYLPILHEKLWRYQEIYNYNSTICNRSNMYRCADSLKCISKHRLTNGIHDCPNSDDENITLINPTVAEEEIIDINTLNDEESKVKLRYARKNISFQTICDGFTELLPVSINGRNETDETECQQWPCNNIYTNFNGVWNCPNGADEIDSDLSSSSSICAPDQYQCVSPNTNQFICLPINKLNDRIVDCLGATDERTLCHTEYEVIRYQNFHCMNQSLKKCISSSQLCNNNNDCYYGDDEQFCTTNKTVPEFSICWSADYTLGSDVENFLCKQVEGFTKEYIIYFTLDGFRDSGNGLTNIENRLVTNSSIIEISDQHKLRCHRGMDLRIWLNDENNQSRKICFCPPSYYGDQCQFQNQRISLSIKFRALSDSWQIPFAIFISLIDDNNEQIIHSYEQFTYLSVRDCKIKHNINLVYSNRPKNQRKNYGIHIDIYEKISLNYRGSFFFPIKFSFLPVHRLPLIIDIPSNDFNIERCSSSQCINGKCIKYLNDNKNIKFCQCNKGWFGRYCTLRHSSMCSPDSLYVGVSPTNQSICICPINKFGSRCLLTNMICQNNENSTCQNGGECIPTDEYQISNKKFICICQKGYTGDRCEMKDNEIILSFEKNIVLSQSIFIHFIEIIKNNIPIRSTTFQTVPIKQDYITILWPRVFHIIFIEFFKKNYYLTVVQNTYNRSSTIYKMINPSDRCQHINEVFNETFIKLDFIRRIKYYHLPCQMSTLNLSCFYDHIHFCLCYNYKNQRLANCFEFNHDMKFDCSGQSACQNGGECFQDTLYCPKRSMCVCSSCFYGTKCQFSTGGFGLSLDAILSYHIIPNLSIIHQPNIVKISSTLNIIFLIAGFINFILTMITFKNKAIRQVGCGIYLLGLSMTTLLTMILFGLKFWIFVLSQMALTSNRSFIKIQCISIDFLLQLCLNMDRWLNACIAIERAFATIKGTRFQKKKSKQLAKIMIVILTILLISSSIYDPFYRHLINEENDSEKRTWCIVTYPSSLQIFNSIMHTFHFAAPFMINLISPIIIIRNISRQQSNVQTHQSYNQLLREKFHQHKSLFIAPVVLVILALPRLIISFALTCMKSANDSWLFLIAYFISFIPSMLTFVIYVLPSNFYKEAFRQSIARYRTDVQRGLRTVLSR